MMYLRQVLGLSQDAAKEAPPAQQQPADSLARQLLPEFEIACHQHTAPECSTCSNVLESDPRPSCKMQKRCTAAPGVSSMASRAVWYSAASEIAQLTPSQSSQPADLKAVTYQWKASPNAVEAGRTPLHKDPALAAEAPSSRHRAEQLVHSLKLVGRWRLLRLLGMGGMSNVYLAQDTARRQRYCALKLTKDHVADFQDWHSDACYRATLLEWETYQMLHDPTGLPSAPVAQAATQPLGESSSIRPDQKRKLAQRGSSVDSGVRAAKLLKAAQPRGGPEAGRGALPVAYGYGFVEHGPARLQHGWLSLQLLGWNLHAVATDVCRPLTWQRFYQLASGMLDAVRLLHLRGLVHRDIKPGNFCLGGSGDCSTVYLVDFGFAQPTPKKAERSLEDKFCGTPDFASTNALLGGKCGPKDDCESLCYSYLQLWNGGNMPWDVTGPEACKSQASPKRRPLAAAATVRGAQVLPPASVTPSPKAGRQDSAAVSEDGSLLGWSPERLRRMADNRTRIWADMERLGEIPSFMLSWQLYLSRLSTAEMPDYDLLQRLLSNSCKSWTAFCHPPDSPQPSISSLSRRPNWKESIDPLLAPEE